MSDPARQINCTQCNRPVQPVERTESRWIHTQTRMALCPNGRTTATPPDEVSAVGDQPQRAEPKRRWMQ